ncbi:hypothetical protein Q7P37_000656 [Cladosporium fusiforme]
MFLPDSHALVKALAAVASLPLALGIELDLNDNDSITSAASTIAFGMMSYYYGNTTTGIPGLLGDPYYWWETGAMFGALIDYWRYTGDSSYNEVTTQAILHQASETRDFMPRNQTKSEGNDDQAFWAFTSMIAAEAGFPDPPGDKPQWLALTQGVFNTQVRRWDEDTCDGGLRWQIFPFNNGYDYKNSISNGGVFNIAARLGAFTRNVTYFEWAERTYDWCSDMGLIDEGTYQIFDGSDSRINCTERDNIQWSYNNGVFLYGAAVMWNQTKGDTQKKWRTRVEGLLKGSRVFFKDDRVMFEAACERNGKCDVDQRSFKAYLARWMAATTKVAPWTYDTVMPYLRSSAMAAAGSCSGGDDGVTCGHKWWVDGWDGMYGVGEQMCALEVIQSNLIERVKGPMSNETGGTSKGDVNAGGNEGDGDNQHEAASIKGVTKADRIGAGFVTAVLVIVTLSAACLSAAILSALSPRPPHFFSTVDPSPGWRMVQLSCISQRWFKATFLTAVAVSIALLAFYQWDVIDDQRSRLSTAVGNLHFPQSSSESSSSSLLPPSNSSPPVPQDFSAGNSTLGFNGIVAVSRGTPWRAEGLAAAAKASMIDLFIPEQPKWSKPFVRAFELFGRIDAHGAALAWLAHIDVLKYIIQNRWGSALVLEDDVDWSVEIREQTLKVAKAVLKLTEQKAGPDTPYGLDWDIIWMGHCGDPPDFKNKPYVAYNDDTVLPLDKYENINHDIITQLKAGQRAVHFSSSPICTWAYAVSAEGARKVMAEASEGRGGAFDLLLMDRCKNQMWKCITVNIELFDDYHPAGGEQSEIRAGEGEQDPEPAASKAMGRTKNILKSARCAGLYNSTCI